MTKEEFEEQIANGQMLEHAEYCEKVLRYAKLSNYGLD